MFNFSNHLTKAMQRQRKLELKKLSAKNLSPFLLESCCLYSDLKVLMREDLGLRPKKSQQVYPFFYVLCRTSKLYRRVFDICNDLKIPSKETDISYHRSVIEFDPFVMKVPSPSLHRELIWLLGQESSESLLGTIRQIRAFNFSPFHEACHKLFYCLISAPKSKSALADYFLFVESLVGVQESILAEQLGPEVSQPLSMINLNYRVPSKGKKPTTRDLGFEDFVSRFLINYAELKSLSLKDLKKLASPELKIHSHDLSGYSGDFAAVVTPIWLDRISRTKLSYAEARKRGQRSALPILELKSYQLEKIAPDFQSLKAIYLWYRSVLH